MARGCCQTVDPLYCIVRSMPQATCPHSVYAIDCCGGYGTEVTVSGANAEMGGDDTEAIAGVKGGPSSFLAVKSASERVS